MEAWRHGRAALVLPAAVAIALAGGCASTTADQSEQEDSQAEVQVVEDAPAEEDLDQAEPEEAEVQDDPEPEESAAESRETLDLSTLDFDAIPAATELTTFSLTDAAAPELSQDSRAAIESALQAAGQLGSVSAVILSCNTGAGIAYGTDTSVYGASSFKGPFVAYLCQELVDTGQISLATMCTVSSSDPYFSGTYGKLGASYSFQTLAEATILDSDNDAFRILHMNLDGFGYYDWLDLTFGEGTFSSRSYFPHVSARIMSKAWAYIWTYLQSGGDTATWLAGLYANTGLSFIRDALAQEGLDATVYNKAGWYGGDPQYNSTTDAGIVEIDGSTYLVATVSDMSYGDASTAALEGVIQALFSARSALG